jgi:hypothetical protein
MGASILSKSGIWTWIATGHQIQIVWQRQRIFLISFHWIFPFLFNFEAQIKIGPSFYLVLTSGALSQCSSKVQTYLELFLVRLHHFRIVLIEIVRRPPFHIKSKPNHVPWCDFRIGNSSMESCQTIKNRKVTPIEIPTSCCDASCWFNPLPFANSWSAETTCQWIYSFGHLSRSQSSERCCESHRWGRLEPATLCESRIVPIKSALPV